MNILLADRHIQVSSFGSKGLETTIPSLTEFLLSVDFHQVLQARLSVITHAPLPPAPSELAARYSGLLLGHP